jgi:raffinose/stachyose/melibiose transport system substrate-binding protein
MTPGTRRTTRFAAGLAALLIFTTACGTSGPSGASGGKPTAWALTGGDEQVFRTSFGTAGIDGQFFGNDAYKQKIRSAVGAGQAPPWSTAGGTAACSSPGSPRARSWT